jgi:transcriptional regulator GlxA family with amidase domain
MTGERAKPLGVMIVAVPETAGSALYGMVDVLSAAGNLWQELVGEEEPQRLIQPQIVSSSRKPFVCGNRIPVRPACRIADAATPDVVVLPELWLGPDECISGRYDAIVEWVRCCYRQGAFIYSACSGAVMLAETGLLDGREATSHWGYERLFRTRFPQVRFKPEPALVFADPAGRIVTAGGTTSWHDLALHIIARHCSPGEAARIAKVYLLKTHSEGQLPYAALVKEAPHADAAVRRTEELLKESCHEATAIREAVQRAGIPERTLKRRFKAATGVTLIDYVQNLRLEEAKRLLETTNRPVEEISAAVGYENSSFFGRLFKRRCGLTPAAYRKMFKVD